VAVVASLGRIGRTAKLVKSACRRGSGGWMRGGGREEEGGGFG
jgi:hypothetical protein